MCGKEIRTKFTQFCAAAGAALLFAGCGRGAYDLPCYAPELDEFTVNARSGSTGRYKAIMCGGREFVYYGSTEETLSDRDIIACVGYTSGDLSKRVCTLSATNDYIVKKNAGDADSKVHFYRAADTAGKKIYTPKYIHCDKQAFWQNGGQK